MHRENCLVLALAGIIWLGTSAAAQVTTATIYGTIVDPSGANVAQARVSVENELTSGKTSTQADEAGSFTLTFLPVGRYSITIRATGFRETRQTGLELAAGQTVRLNFPLEVGAVTENVTVTAEAPLINTGNAEQQQGLVTKQLAELPFARRDWTTILQLGTGVVTEGASSTNGVSLNGLASSGMRFTVDGTNASGTPEYQSLAMSSGNNNYIKGVSLEAIEEVSIAKGIFSAEIADTLSGGVNVITKSGTNQFHGSLFEANQASAYSARYQFSAIKTPLVLNQFGGSFGGPIKRNKLFFFGVYEGYRYYTRQYVSGYVPSLSFRAQAVQAVPAYKQFLDLLPLPTSVGTAGPTAGFFQGANTANAHDDHADVRTDYYLNESNRLAVRYSRGRPELSSPRVSPLNPRTFNYVAEMGTVIFTHSTASWTNETRFGDNHSEMRRLDQLLLSGIPTIPSISGTPFGVAGLGSGEDYRVWGSDISFEEVIAKTRGRHSVKFGGLFMRTRDSRARQELPNFSYASVADFLANIPASLYFSAGENPDLMKRWQMGYFIQDDFKVTPHLVVNLGLRYDYFQVPKEENNRFFNRGDPFGFGPLRPPGSIFDADRKDFGPRVGFAWTLDRSGKTVVRGGLGMFYVPLSLFAGVVDIVRNAADIPQHLTPGRVDGLRYGLTYPLSNQQAYAIVSPRMDPLFGSTTVVSTFFPNPYSVQWTLSVARQLTGTLALETAYVANHGVHLLYKQDENFVDRQTGLRPNPNFQEYEYDTPWDSSHYNSWQNSVRKRFSDGFSANVHYTWASSVAYGRGDLSNVTSAYAGDMSRERGPVPYFMRRLFISDFVYELPFAKLMGSPRRSGRLLASGWQFAGILTAETGLPIETAVSQSSTLINSRGDYIGGPPYLSNYSTTLQYLNPAAFARIPLIPVSGALAHEGNINRAALFAPGAWNLDLALSKNLDLAERMRLQIRADMFNSLNHTNFNSVDGNVTSGTFGKITGTRGARLVQLKARLTF
jgi:hypothetical protein